MDFDMVVFTLMHVHRTGSRPTVPFGNASSEFLEAAIVNMFSIIREAYETETRAHAISLEAVGQTCVYIRWYTYIYMYRITKQYNKKMISMFSNIFKVWLYTSVRIAALGHIETK